LNTTELATEAFRNQYLSDAESDPSTNEDLNQDQPEDVPKPLQGLEFLAYLEARPYEVSPGVTVMLPPPLSKLTQSTTALRGSVSSSSGSDSGEETGEIESGNGMSTSSSSSSITAKPIPTAEVLPLRISREGKVKVDDRASKNHSTEPKRMTSYRDQRPHVARMNGESRGRQARRGAETSNQVHFEHTI
jgi:hypothetical protein